MNTYIKKQVIMIDFSDYVKETAKTNVRNKEVKEAVLKLSRDGSLGIY